VTVDLMNKTVEYHHAPQLPWRVTLVDTGLETMTGGRIRRILPYLEGDETFCLTYGDGVGDIDIAASVKFHRSEGSLATMTVVRPPARFGTVAYSAEGRVLGFEEKGPAAGHSTNGGFFVLERGAVDVIDGDSTSWEAEPLQRLAAKGQLSAFQHDGFWQPMDTLWERDYLERLWASGEAPWKVWS
jgi:glucose-1-phosphate cytidylyltransferase